MLSRISWYRHQYLFPISATRGLRRPAHLASPISLLSPPALSGEDTQGKVVTSDLVGNDQAVVRNESRKGDIISGDRRFDVIHRRGGDLDTVAAAQRRCVYSGVDPAGLKSNTRE
jgi:hypothetical protein